MAGRRLCLIIRNLLLHKTNVMKRTQPLLLLFLVVAVLMGCAKDGDNGEDGDVGPAGQAGADGASIVSNLYNVTTTDWTLINNDYLVELNALDITTDVFDNGLILVYMSDGANGWYTMPYTYYLGGGEEGQYLPLIEVGNVEIINRESAGNPSNPGNKTFRVVIMDQNTQMQLNNEHVDYYDYNVLSNYYKW